MQLFIFLRSQLFWRYSLHLFQWWRRVSSFLISLLQNSHLCWKIINLRWMMFHKKLMINLSRVSVKFCCIFKVQSIILQISFRWSRILKLKLFCFHPSSERQTVNVNLHTLHFKINSETKYFKLQILKNEQQSSSWSDNVVVLCCACACAGYAACEHRLAEWLDVIIKLGSRPCPCHDN